MEIKKLGWVARPKNDRLQRYCILDMDSPGTGKQVMADNIRQERHADIMAAGPELLNAAYIGLGLAMVVSKEYSDKSAENTIRAAINKAVKEVSNGN